MPRRPLALLVPLALVLAVAACSSSDGEGSGRPTVAVSTTILGDVVQRLVGDAVEVQVLMPRGADPHDVQLSAKEAADVREAEALVVNGAGFEAGLHDVLEAAEADGVPTHEAIAEVEAIPFGEAEHHEGDGHDHDEGEGIDPHFFTDPARMADAAEGIAAFLAEQVPALAEPAARQRATGVVEDLRALDAEVEEVLAAIPDERRVLVTNHEVFGYFADRYGFEVVGTVIPGGATQAEPGAGELDELAHVIEDEGVPAIFVDTSAPAALAEALAAEVGDVEVVALFSESLGEEGSGGATYDEMVRTNAERIATALG